MSHVDEGTIHALLDGALAPKDPARAGIEAHLAMCADCRARIEVERRLRDRATHVLEQIAPDATRVEPFDRVIAARRGAVAPTAGATAGSGPDVSPSRSFRVPLTLAATVTLAITGLWFARQYLPQPRTPATLEMEADAIESSIREPVTTRPATVSEAPQAERGAQNEARTAADEVGRQRAGGAYRDTATRSGVRAQAGAPPEAPPIAPAQDLRRSGEETRRIDSLMRSGRALALEEIVVTGVTAQAAKVSSPDTDTFGARVLATADSLTWQTIESADALDRLGRTPVTIEGLAIDSVQSATLDGHALIRVVQTVRPGVAVELIEWSSAVLADAAADRDLRANAPPPAAEGAREEKFAGVATQLVQLDGATILLRAPLPPDSLAAIARRAK